MNAVQRVAQLKAQTPEQWLRTGNRYLPPVVTAVLIVAIAYKLAEITWALAPGAPLDGPAPAVAGRPADAAARPAQPAAELSGLIDAHLFGRASETAAQPAPAVIDAPDTTLSLRLTGVIADHNGEDSGYAVIASGRNQEHAYGVGDAIEGGSGATLHSVHQDRVILNRGGNLETLRLPQEFSSGPPPAMPRVAAAPVTTDPADGGTLREVISDNATRFTDILRVAPHLEGGRMVGFRVNPGRNRELFAALGLEPGDVVTDINGIVLDDASRGVQLFESLGESTMANITIMRDGAPQVMVIDTSQLENLAEGLQ